MNSTPVRFSWKKRLLISLTTAACILAALATTLYIYARRFDQKLAPGGNFTLQGASGPLTLTQFKGKGVVLYFGYTSCPDVCPLSMSKLSQALKMLPTAERERIVPIFVSVDWRKDTPESVQKYVSYFLSQAIGVTGTQTQLAPVLSQYGAIGIVEDEPGSALGYSVQHPTSFYLVNRDGTFTGEIPTEMTKAEIAAELKNLI